MTGARLCRASPSTSASAPPKPSECTAPGRFAFCKPQPPRPHLAALCMTPLTVRELTSADRTVWCRMRLSLWPDETARGHDAAIDEILDAKDAWGFIAEAAGNEPLGFAEISIRKAA